ncbi:DUF6318 family protein [Winkia neuii]|uniref:DUF6318 domain-containing protein n=2 Tax=Winkia neuii TaxID=33007 RepID=A0A2I1IQX4_9ACTO|nr:DUF6318 family protein [Winkia neuii]MDK8100574.1 DUF6318 family protein [Winkia neuii]PKY73517.1 hypothetical protein CYJ19_02740 [Winkia neuii]
MVSIWLLHATGRPGAIGGGWRTYPQIVLKRLRGKKPVGIFIFVKHATKHLAATALALALLCTGCSTAKNSTPEEKPTQPSPTQTPSQTPTPKSGWEDGPPLLPVQAQNNTQEGAIATGKFFIEANDYAIQTGDTQPMQEVIAKEGTAKQDFSSVEETLSKKGTWVSDKIKTELMIAEPRENTDLYVQFAVTQPPQTSTKNPRKKNQGFSLYYGMNLIYSNGRWNVKDFYSIDKDEAERKNNAPN